MVKNNNPIHRQIGKKDWRYIGIKCFFDSQTKKIKRRKARKEKAAKMFPRPLKPLKPLVRPPSLKFNNRLRYGKGFTLEELKAAGLNPAFAKTIGITYDSRRWNQSEQSFQLNTSRLKEYLNNLVLYPKKVKKPHKEGRKGYLNDTPVEQLKTIQVKQPIETEILPRKLREPVKLPEPKELPKSALTKSAVRMITNQRKFARLVGYHYKKIHGVKKEKKEKPESSGKEEAQE